MRSPRKKSAGPPGPALFLRARARDGRSYPATRDLHTRERGAPRIRDRARPSRGGRRAPRAAALLARASNMARPRIRWGLGGRAALRASRGEARRRTQVASIAAARDGYRGAEARARRFANFARLRAYSPAWASQERRLQGFCRYGRVSATDAGRGAWRGTKARKHGNDSRMFGARGRRGEPGLPRRMR